MAGTYRLYSCADRAFGVITESDEANNCTWGDTFTVAAPVAGIFGGAGQTASALTDKKSLFGRYGHTPVEAA